MPRLLSRLAALALFGALLLAIWALIGAPLLDRAARLSAEIEQAEALIAGFERRAPPQPVAAPDPAAATAYLTGETTALAAAALQDRLSQMAEAAGLTLNSMRVREGAAPGGVGLRIALTGGYADIAGFLHRIEAERPLLFIPSLRLTPTGEEGADGGRRLSALIDIDGYLAEGGE